MEPLAEYLQQTRRRFFTSTASGLGLAALTSLLAQDGLLSHASADENGAVDADNPLHVRAPHFAPKAKRCIFFYLEGAPSQMDLFDPKPKLNELNGQKLPESLVKNVRFAFIQKDSATILGS